MFKLSLSDLPQEIIFQILALVDGRTVINSGPLVGISLCCTLPEDSTRTSQTVCFPAIPVAPSMEGLEALHRHQCAWLALNWTSRTVFPIEPSSHAYELVDGVFAQLRSGSFTTLRLPSVGIIAPNRPRMLIWGFNPAIL
ncbi:hypothetical protein C8R43DRAFT_41388 [Mycena crocata]|nr:hypothetical protein C8R43DRAFT_41388 [Mycena crocata]